MEQQKTYTPSYTLLLKLYLLAMTAFSLAVVCHNGYLAFNPRFWHMPLILCVVLKIVLNIADLFALYLLYRFRNLGLWILMSTAFFTILLRLGYPSIMPTQFVIIGLSIKLALLIFMLFEKDGLNGFQSIGVSRINGKFIDEYKNDDEIIP